MITKQSSSSKKKKIDRKRKKKSKDGVGDSSVSSPSQLVGRIFQYVTRKGERKNYVIREYLPSNGMHRVERWGVLRTKANKTKDIDLNEFQNIRWLDDVDVNEDKGKDEKNSDAIQHKKDDKKNKKKEDKKVNDKIVNNKDGNNNEKSNGKVDGKVDDKVNGKIDGKIDDGIEATRNAKPRKGNLNSLSALGAPIEETAPGEDQEEQVATRKSARKRRPPLRIQEQQDSSDGEQGDTSNSNSSNTPTQTATKKRKPHKPPSSPIQEEQESSNENSEQEQEQESSKEDTARESSNENTPNPNGTRRSGRQKRPPSRIQDEPCWLNAVTPKKEKNKKRKDKKRRKVLIEEQEQADSRNESGTPEPKFTRKNFEKYLALKNKPPSPRYGLHSKYKGVTRVPIKRGRKPLKRCWRARCGRRDFKKIHGTDSVGTYESEIDAAKAIDAIMRKYSHALDATFLGHINFPTDEEKAAYLATEPFEFAKQEKALESKYNGVTRNFVQNARKTWRARCGRRAFVKSHGSAEIGTYRKETEAALAYDAALRKHSLMDSTDLGMLNFPTEEEKERHAGPPELRKENLPSLSIYNGVTRSTMSSRKNFWRARSGHKAFVKSFGSDNIGVFPTEIDAAKAFDAALRKHSHVLPSSYLSRINFPTEEEEKCNSKTTRAMGAKRSSRYRGVSRDKSGHKWCCRVCRREFVEEFGTSYHGFFDSEAEAAKAYDDAVRKWCNTYTPSQLNFPTDADRDREQE